MSRLTSLMAPCLVGYVAALSRGMPNLCDSGEFDPKERPFRITTTDVNKVSMYHLEHLLDVSMEEHMQPPPHNKPRSRLSSIGGSIGASRRRVAVVPCCHPSYRARTSRPTGKGWSPVVFFRPTKP